MPPFCELLLIPALKLTIAGLLILAAARDIMTRTVPNWMPIALAAAGIALASCDVHLTWGLGFGLAVFLASLICWWRGWMGGGDVKLLGAAAIVVSPPLAAMFLVAVSFAGGILAIAYLLGRFVLPDPARYRPAQSRTVTIRPATIRPANDRPRHLLRRVLRVEAWRIRHRGPLPYACAIAAGTIFVLS